MIINKKFNNYIITNNFVLWLKKTFEILDAQYFTILIYHVLYTNP